MLMELHGPESTRVVWKILTAAGYKICWMRPGCPVIPSLEAPGVEGLYRGETSPGCMEFMNMIRYPGKLALQQRVLTPYRAAFFDALAAACDGGLSIFAGLPVLRNPLPPRTC